MWFKRKKETNNVDAEASALIKIKAYTERTPDSEGRIIVTDEEYEELYEYWLRNCSYHCANKYGIYVEGKMFTTKEESNKMDIEENNRQMVLEAMFQKETGMSFNSNQSLFESWKQIKGY